MDKYVIRRMIKKIDLSAYALLVVRNREEKDNKTRLKL